MVSSSRGFLLALVNRTDDLDLIHTRNSGFLGLAFPSLATPPRSEGTILDNIFSQLSGPNRFFAFKLGRYDSQTGISSSSSFTIGEFDPLITNDATHMSWFPVFRAYGSPYDFWKLKIRGITINSQPLPLSHSIVHGVNAPIGILDSGTTLILGPRHDVGLFWNAVGTGNSVRYNQQSQAWQVRCNRAVDVRIKLGEMENANDFALHPVDIAWGDSGEGWCLGGLQASDKVRMLLDARCCTYYLRQLKDGDWILGNVFLRVRLFRCSGP